MTDKELDDALKLAKVPERSAAFWKEFPRRVTKRLRIDLQKT